ncbi:hypothetical protein KEM55_005643 [Ascosphaera atra]|nr:hypothetical protein KEM55_005643 [Ascosphaera atra]
MEIYLQPHPDKQLAGKYQTVLVVGNDVEKCRAVAKQYGFRDVLTTHDVIKTDPTIAPFKKLTEEEKSSAITRCLPETVVDAIIVFSSSKDWGADQQVILDLCMSQGGRFGTRSRRFGEGPVVYFAHSDVIWSNEHEFPRLGLGALRTSLEAIYRELTGQELGTVAIGKPQSLVFHFAERTLRQHRFQDHGIERAPETIYFVGDTPESDILGTNKYHTTGYSESVWRSILVESGVYEHGTTPRYKPFKIVPNALAAVRFAMELEQDKLMNHKQRRTFRESIKRLSR